MGLPAQLDEQLTGALSAERAKVEADERAAASVSSWWTSVIDADSAAAAARTDALAGRHLYELHERRAAAVRDSGDVDALATLLRDIGDEVALPSALLTIAPSLTVTGAVRAVGGDTVRDIASPMRWPATVWLLLAIVAAVVLLPVLGLARRAHA